MWIFWTILLIVAAVLLLSYSWTGDGLQGLAGQFSALCFIIVILIVTTNTSKPVPTDLDVYQGKTTLEITYKDGVPLDSVVVFKD